jgi:hypothetical protein
MRLYHCLARDFGGSREGEEGERSSLLGFEAVEEKVETPETGRKAASRQGGRRTGTGSVDETR